MFQAISIFEKTRSKKIYNIIKCFENRKWKTKKKVHFVFIIAAHSIARQWLAYSTATAQRVNYKKLYNTFTHFVRRSLLCSTLLTRLLDSMRWTLRWWCLCSAFPGLVELLVLLLSFPCVVSFVVSIAQHTTYDSPLVGFVAFLVCYYIKWWWKLTKKCVLSLCSLHSGCTISYQFRWMVGGFALECSFLWDGGSGH